MSIDWSYLIPIIISLLVGLITFLQFSKRNLLISLVICVLVIFNIIDHINKDKDHKKEIVKHEEKENFLLENIEQIKSDNLKSFEQMKSGNMKIIQKQDSILNKIMKKYDFDYDTREKLNKISKQLANSENNISTINNYNHIINNYYDGLVDIESDINRSVVNTTQAYQEKINIIEITRENINTDEYVLNNERSSNSQQQENIEIQTTEDDTITFPPQLDTDFLNRTSQEPPLPPILEIKFHEHRSVVNSDEISLSGVILGDVENVDIVELVWENKSDDGEIFDAGVATGFEQWHVDNINLDIGKNEITVFAENTSGGHVALPAIIVIIYEPPVLSD